MPTTTIGDIAPSTALPHASCARTQAKRRRRQNQHRTPHHRFATSHSNGGQFRQSKATLRRRTNSLPQLSKRNATALLRHPHGECRHPGSSPNCQRRKRETREATTKSESITTTHRNFAPPSPAEAARYAQINRKNEFSPSENQKLQLNTNIAPTHRILSHSSPQKILVLTEIPYINDHI